MLQSETGLKMDGKQFAQLSRKIGQLDKRLEKHAHVAAKADQLERDVEAMKVTVAGIMDTIATNHTVAIEARELAKVAADNSDEIIAVLKHAKGVGGFVAKHGPRVIAFAIGSLVASGAIGEKWGGLLRTLFGVS